MKRNASETSKASTSLSTGSVLFLVSFRVIPAVECEGADRGKGRASSALYRRPRSAGIKGDSEQVPSLALYSHTASCAGHDEVHDSRRSA